MWLQSSSGRDGWRKGDEVAFALKMTVNRPGKVRGERGAMETVEVVKAQGMENM